MMRVGSLFTGYGGLDLAVGGDLIWCSEVNASACTILEAHFPKTINIGDVTQYGDCTCGDVIPWDHLPQVDVITAGYPCQPFSESGNRKGTSDERNLWPYVRDAICSIQPARVVLENVRGHLSLGFDVVLADLARMGWSARWGVVRASDAGAPHDRPRLFVIANPDGATRTQQVKWSQAYDATSRRNDAPGRCVHASHWGEYREAVCRWTHVVGREAPEPTRNGISSTRITPAFVEWMMGLPEGWVTGHGLTASQELKMLGNGVVPQQAALALNLLDGAA